MKRRATKRTKAAASRTKSRVAARVGATRRATRAGRAGVAIALRRTPAETAQLILDSANVALATGHASGRLDDANARQNVLDTAAGLPARRSAYGNAPGGTVGLHASLLDGILSLAEVRAIRVSELAGGSHSPNSRHYVGVALDIDRIGGSAVSASNPHVAAVKQTLRDLGATEVLGPGDPGHATHVHGAWPRP